MIEPSKSLAAARAAAREAAASRRQRFITLEHLLYGITRTAEGAAILRGVGADPDDMARELEEYLDLLESGQPREPQPDATADEMLRLALIHVHVGGRTTIELGDVLVQLLRYEDEYAALLFHAAGIERFAVLRFVSHGAPPVPEIPDTPWLTVRFHNDHYTTMHFVVQVLTRTFRMSLERAQALMLLVHEQGHADVTTLKRADAIERAVEALELAEKAELPLRITLERAE